MATKLGPEFAGYTVSEGTLRDEDLMVAFEQFIISHLPKEVALEMIAEKRETEGAPEDPDWLAWYVNFFLFDLLEEAAPEGCVFGAHEGDGALFGFWLSRDTYADHNGNQPTQETFLADGTTRYDYPDGWAVLEAQTYATVYSYAEGRREVATVYRPTHKRGRWVLAQIRWETWGVQETSVLERYLEGIRLAQAVAARYNLEMATVSC